MNHSLSLVNLTGLEKRYPGQLSGGQQQRVALARALVLNPDVLLLDEPLSNLDAKIRQQVRAEIRKLQKDLAITAIYVTHDQEEALTLSDRIAVLDHGKLQQLGSPRDLYQRPENPFVADFIGINNLIAGQVKEIQEAKGWMAVETRFGLIKCAFEGAVHDRRGLQGHRPPRGRLPLQLRRKNRDDMNLIAGKVSFASYIGNTIRYDIELDPETIFKVDVQNPWNQQPFPIGREGACLFPHPDHPGDSRLRKRGLPT